MSVFLKEGVKKSGMATEKIIINLTASLMHVYEV